MPGFWGDISTNIPLGPREAVRRDPSDNYFEPFEPVDRQTFDASLANIESGPGPSSYDDIQDASIQQALSGSSPGVDASIVRIDNYQTVQDASILQNELDISSLDASIVRIDNYNAVQDTSISAITSLDASIVRTDAYQAVQDASILQNELDISSLDASIVRTDAYQAVQDASILGNEDSISSLDASIVRIDDYNAIQDASIAAGSGGPGPSSYDQIQDASIAAGAGGPAPSQYDAVQDSSIALALSGGGTVDASLDYSQYTPITGDTSIFRTGDLVTQIVTTNTVGTKQVDFTYDSNGDILQVDVSKYGQHSRTVTFGKDSEGNITNVYVN